MGSIAQHRKDEACAHKRTRVCICECVENFGLYEVRPFLIGLHSEMSRARAVKLGAYRASFLRRANPAEACEYINPVQVHKLLSSGCFVCAEDCEARGDEISHEREKSARHLHDRSAMYDTHTRTDLATWYTFSSIPSITSSIGAIGSSWVSASNSETSTGPHSARQHRKTHLNSSCK